MNAVIMAGGKGKRFWPRSVEAKPKQFLELTASGETMLQVTYRRLRSWLPSENIYVSTAQKYVSLVREQLPGIDEKRMIVEPEQRDTAPGIALVALSFLARGNGDVFATIPSDHHIGDEKALGAALRQAASVAEEEGAIVTLGVAPTRPETGYGYIRASELPGGNGVFKVSSFIEKPDTATAKKLVRQRHVFWNSGIFVWKPSTVAHYMAKFQPDMWTALNEGTDRLDAVYKVLPGLSVDYAIMEKADRIYMIPARFEWDDVGSWTSLERVRVPDADGNVKEGFVETVDSRNNIVFSESARTIVIGASDLIVVSTADGLLVCHKSREQSIKTVLQSLKSKGDGGDSEDGENSENSENSGT